VAVRGSVTPVHPRTSAAEQLFDALGGTIAVDDEGAYEALSAASATVAAHFDYLCAVSDWLETRGIPGDQARRYVADHFAALAPELLAGDVDFASLASAHSTRGGLNEQFAHHMRAAGTADAVRDGLDALLARIAGA
jgi:pyrroline-5-carboxylate reductase